MISDRLINKIRTKNSKNFSGHKLPKELDSKNFKDYWLAAVESVKDNPSGLFKVIRAAEKGEKLTQDQINESIYCLKV